VVVLPRDAVLGVAMMHGDVEVRLPPPPTQRRAPVGNGCTGSCTGSSIGGCIGGCVGGGVGSGVGGYIGNDSIGYEGLKVDTQVSTDVIRAIPTWEQSEAPLLPRTCKRR